ncbi:MAG: sigma-54-dependent Fis family transcriptional regulator [Bacteroidaceae bacterium]|jgi:DNA-binding NtrC family response regulator|nr:sigma-54-dependent Fis family transcriptional regulator [Bacteroidaceae bacterium]
MNNPQIQTIKQRYGIAGNCDALNRALEVALKIAPVDLSVLVTGENGVGKENFPRIIHDHSLRKTKKFFAVNCGAIPEGTIDSELFGHEKGAFTGAIERREGYFSVANGGTLFLDEVGELPLSTQARLLRVLETGEYIPVGASEVKRTDVRIVAATNVNIEQAIKDGKFREDLYYRLNSVSIAVPALRERGNDILLLFKKFVLELSEKYKMPPIRLTQEAQDIILSYSWPGNVRQLKNLAENMMVTSEEREITDEILRMYLPVGERSNQLITVANESSNHSFENEREILYQILFDLRRDVNELKSIINASGNINKPATEVREHIGSELTFIRSSEIPQTSSATQIKDDERQTFLAAEEVRDNDYINDAEKQTESLESIEKETIQKALNYNRGKRKLTAEQLGISERTLYRKIKEYGLD